MEEKSWKGTVKNRFSFFLNVKPRSFYDRDVRTLSERLEKIVEHHGDYT